MTYRPFSCVRCKKEAPRHQLSEIFGWGLYACTPCIENWTGEGEDMSECTVRGCRTLTTKCDDCDRVTCTYGKPLPAEGDDWYDVEAFPPEYGQPVEYQIVVRVRGWAIKNGEKTEFMPHHGIAPESKIMSYRKWDGPSMADGFALNDEIIKKKQEEANDAGS